MKRLVLGTSLL